MSASQAWNSQPPAIPITFFGSFAASKKVEEQFTLPALAARIRAQTAVSKGKLPWLKLATFGEKRNPNPDEPDQSKWSLRHDANVLAITGLEADYDGEQIPFTDAVEIATKADLSCIVYTSPSHTENSPRWRVLCPTSQQLPPDRRAKLLGRINGLYRGIFSVESWTLSQSYYFGSVAHNPSHQVEVIEGRPIDEIDELDEIWTGKPQTKDGLGAGTQSGPADEGALIQQIIAGESYHTASVRLLGKWARDGIAYMAARRRLEDAFDQVFPPDRDQRWHARRADLDRCLGDIYGKEAAKRDTGTLAPTSADPLLNPWNALQPPSFPKEALPVTLRRFVENRAQALGADPCAIAWAAISACSSALDARIRLKMKRHDAWSVPPQIWVALVGRVSAKKSPIIDAAWAPLQRAQAQDLKAWQDELAQWHRLPKNERGDQPVPRRRLVSHDATPEALQDVLGRQDRGIGVLRDELAGWIGSLEKYASARGGAADRAFFLQGFNGGAHVVDRVSRGTVPVNNLALTLCGGIQPDRLRQFGDLTDDGLWQRFLPVVMHPASIGTDIEGDDAPQEYDELIRRLLLVPHQIRAALCDAAHPVREDVERRAHELEASEVISAGFSGFCGKLHGLWGRLALVLSQVEPEGFPAIVSLRAAEAARTLIFESALPNAARVYTEMGGSGGDVEATRSIAGFILTKRKKRILASDLTTNVWACRRQSLETVQRLLSPLIAGGWLTPEQDYAPTAWAVSDGVHDRFADRARQEAARRRATRALIVGAQSDPENPDYARERDRDKE